MTPKNNLGKGISSLFPKHNEETCILLQQNKDQKARENDQEIPQSHNADQPTALRGRAAEH